MISQAENVTLTQVGPGTPMGELMRRYWMPALLSWELAEPDGEPVRVKLLGEELVAFRDTDGRIGLLDEFCPHRLVSLWLGRNEDCGLRCVYHGWKFDVNGQCVDMMNEPEDSDFPSKMTTTSYPTVELGGVIWAYMGPKEHMPPPPKFEWAAVPETHRHVTKNIQECNWLQALEGGIDSAHATILHRTLRTDTAHAGLRVDSPHVRGKPPELEVDITDYGYRYVGIRSLGDEGNHVRAYHFVMPFHQIRASQRGYRARRVRWASSRPATCGSQWTTTMSWSGTGTCRTTTPLTRRNASTWTAATGAGRSTCSPTSAPGSTATTTG